MPSLVSSTVWSATVPLRSTLSTVTTLAPGPPSTCCASTAPSNCSLVSSFHCKSMPTPAPKLNTNLETTSASSSVVPDLSIAVLILFALVTLSSIVVALPASLNITALFTIPLSSGIWSIATSFCSGFLLSSFCIS